METRTDDLGKRYGALSDAELIELYKSGGLTGDADAELSRQLSARGLDGAKVDRLLY